MPPPVPGAVSKLAAGRPLYLLWHNQVGGLTYAVGGPGAPDPGPPDPGPPELGPPELGPPEAGPPELSVSGRGASGPGAAGLRAAGLGAAGLGAECVVKWAPAGAPADLSAERARLDWAGSWTPVPRPLDGGSDEAGSWLVTSVVPGTSAVTPRWRADPATAVAALGRGLRALHDALPVAACPFSWDAATRLADARHRAAAGQVDPSRWHAEYRDLGLDAALAQAAGIPPVDRLVVCQGDACAPNTLLDPGGNWCAHVDLGDLGVADRWADLAVATWSTEWNYGPGWAGALLDAYGVGPDPARTRYYRLLWELGP